MIALFSPSTESAAVRGLSWLALFCGIAFFVVHLIPPQLLLFLMTGPNARTVLAMVPLAASIVDWSYTCYNAIPDLLRTAFEIAFLSAYRVAASVVMPSSFATWASMAAVVVAISGAYWYSRSLLITKKIVRNAPLPFGYVIVHATVILIITVAMVTLVFKFLPSYTNIITSGVGPGRYIGCLMFAGLVSTVYIAVSPIPPNMRDIELAHIETLSIVSSITAITCMLVQRINS